MTSERPFDRRPTSSGPGWFESSFDLDRGLDVSEAWFEAPPADAWLAHRPGAADARFVPTSGRETASARSRPPGGG